MNNIYAVFMFGDVGYYKGHTNNGGWGPIVLHRTGNIRLFRTEKTAKGVLTYLRNHNMDGFVVESEINWSRI